MVFDVMPWRRNRNDVARQQDQRAAQENPLLDLHREIDDVFNSFLRDFGTQAGSPLAAFGREDGGFPSLNVSETDEALEVSAEVPGMDENDINVTLDPHMLTIEGEKKDESEDKQKNYHVVERSYGHIRRSVPLPEGLDVDNAKATFKKGVLDINIPKKEEAKQQRRQVQIESGE